MENLRDHWGLKTQTTCKVPVWDGMRTWDGGLHRGENLLADPLDIAGNLSGNYWGLIMNF